MLISIVIPSRKGGNETTTLQSLAKQTLRDFQIVVSKDMDKRGACWARNQGFRLVDTPFVLFSDNDIDWEPDALETLHTTLQTHPEASYSYGWYAQEGGRISDQPFDAEKLKSMNYISTMSLIRTRDFPGFDEGIRRLQDWDVWLTMLEQNKRGVYCGKKVFSTKKRAGITYGGDSPDYNTARRIVRTKHGLE